MVDQVEITGGVVLEARVAIDAIPAANGNPAVLVPTDMFDQAVGKI